ncbi:MAG: response regulator [Proteobacteria bacterium]|nr:response regulator [Pseudomonadota bacterium]
MKSAIQILKTVTLILLFMGGGDIKAQKKDLTCFCVNSWEVLTSKKQTDFTSNLPEEIRPAKINELAWEPYNRGNPFFRRSLDYWSVDQNDYWMRHKIPPLTANQFALGFYETPQLRSLYMGSTKIWTNINPASGNIYDLEPKIISLPSDIEKEKYIYAHYNIADSKSARKYPETMRFGSLEGMVDKLLTLNILIFLIALICIAAGVTFIVLFALNREQKVLFYLFILSFSFGLQLLTSYLILSFWWPILSVYLLCFYYVFPIGIIGFYQNFYATEAKKVLDFLMGFHVIYALIAVILVSSDPSWHRLLLAYMQVFWSLDIICLAVVIFPIVYRKPKQSNIVSAGLISPLVMGGLSVIQDFWPASLPAFPYLEISMMFFLTAIIAMLYKTFRESKELIVGYGRELEKKNLELNQLDQLKDEFLAKTSHELRTPLHGIIGIADSLNDNEAISQKHLRSRAEIIINNARRLNRLINDILDSASLKAQRLSLKRSPISFHRTVSAVFELISPIADQKALSLINNASVDLPPVDADEERLQQILLNLLGNALRFTEHGQIEISAQVEENNLSVTITDTGSGIEKSQQDKIFQAFETGRESSAGTGLGLTIVRDLVHLHGGEIHLDKEIKSGARFLFTIPLSSSTEPLSEFSKISDSKTHLPNYDWPILAVGEEEDEEQSSAVENGEYRLLIVDDEPVNLQILKTQLKPKGFNLQFASSALEALGVLAEHKTDLILLDVMMPGMDGFELCKKIREQKSLINLPIIFLTAKTRTADIIQGYKSGGNDYLPKPFSKEELLARIRLQLQMLVARDCLASLRTFSNQIGDLQDTDKLVESAFEVMTQALRVDKSGLYLDQKLLKEFKKDQSGSLPEIQKIELSSSDAHSVKSSIQVPDEYTFFLQRDVPFSLMDREYIQNVIAQLSITQKNLYDLVSDPKKLEILSFISTHIDSILYIQSEGNYCTIATEEQNEVPKLYRISLKGIKLHYADIHLLQTHRSFLINPGFPWQYAMETRKKSHLFYGDISIPVGRSYLNSLDRTFPQFKVRAHPASLTPEI